MKKFTHRDAIAKVLAYIDTHRADPLELDTLARIACAFLGEEGIILERRKDECQYID